MKSGGGKKYQVSQNGLTQGSVVRQLHLFPMLQHFILTVFNILKMKLNKAPDCAQINIAGELLNRNEEQIPVSPFAFKHDKVITVLTA